jgi:hypothetical protein
VVKQITKLKYFFIKDLLFTQPFRLFREAEGRRWVNRTFFKFKRTSQTLTAGLSPVSGL